MKKILLITAIFCMSISSNINAQCTPDGGASVGITPADGATLTAGTIGSSYGETFTIVVPADTLGFTVIGSTVLGITGIPTGLTYTCAPNLCVFPGGGTDCFIIDGFPSVFGTFTIVVSMEAEVDLMGVIPLPDNTYTLVIADTASGCAAPSASFTPPSINDLEVTFTDGSTVSGPATYLWTFGDLNTSTSQDPSNTYATAGSYNVCLAVTDSCGTNSYCDSVTVLLSGIGETNGLGIMDMTILPNPAFAMTQIRFNSPTTESIRFQLYNMIGEKLVEKVIESSAGRNDIDLDVSEFKSGIYFVSLSSDDNTITRKLVVSRR